MTTRVTTRAVTVEASGKVSTGQIGAGTGAPVTSQRRRRQLRRKTTRGQIGGICDAESGRRPVPGGFGGGARLAGLPRDPGRRRPSCCTKRHGATVFRYAWHLLGRPRGCRGREPGDLPRSPPSARKRDGRARAGRLGCSGSRAMSVSAGCGNAARTPGSSSLDGSSPARPAAWSGWRRCAIRCASRETRCARCRCPEREAFVLREVARPGNGGGGAGDEPDVRRDREPRGTCPAAVSCSPSEVSSPQSDVLTHARRSRRGRSVVRERCTCFAVPCAVVSRRALRPPEATGVPAIVGQRLAGALPGFASGGGGIVALLTTKAAAAPLLARRPPSWPRPS